MKFIKQLNEALRHIPKGLPGKDDWGEGNASYWVYFNTYQLNDFEAEDQAVDGLRSYLAKEGRPDFAMNHTETMEDDDHRGYRYRIYNTTVDEEILLDISYGLDIPIESQGPTVVGTLYPRNLTR